jgi:hypothetical protein
LIPRSRSAAAVTNACSRRSNYGRRTPQAEHRWDAGPAQDFVGVAAGGLKRGVRGFGSSVVKRMPIPIDTRFCERVSYGTTPIIRSDSAHGRNRLSDVRLSDEAGAVAWCSTVGSVMAERGSAGRHAWRCGATGGVGEQIGLESGLTARLVAASAGRCVVRCFQYICGSGLS